ncbi:Nephrin, partial [Stegodyphus mimosarum]
EGYHDGDIVQVGDKLTLACISRGGNPPARLIWFRNDDQVDITYSTGGREATNTHTFTVGPKDNKAIYKCEASNVVTLQPLSASVRLNVLFAPTKVVISGPKEVRVGESVTLSCKTGSSNPPVEVSW